MSRLLLTTLAMGLMLALAVVGGQATAAPVPFVADGSTDIGDPLNLVGNGNDPMQLGSYSVTGTVHTVAGGGGDWWDWSERGHVAYKQMPAGEWRVESAISALPQALPVGDPGAPGDYDQWVKAGVFIRNDVDVGTLGDEREVNAFMAALRQDRNESAFQWRPDANDNWMGNTQYGGPNPPQKVAIQRRLVGTMPLVEGFVSFDGTSWEMVGGQYMFNLADQPYAGLAVTAHRNQAGHLLSVDFTDPVVTDVYVPPPTPMRALGFTPPQGGIGTWGVREVDGAGDVGSLEDTVTRLNEDADGTNPGVRVDYHPQEINIWDSGTRGHFYRENRAGDHWNEDPYQVVAEGHEAAGNVDHISLVMSGTIDVPEPGGWYTFDVNSDDGFELAIDGNVVMEANYGKGASDVFGYAELTPGRHSIRVLNWEGGGGAAVEVLAAPGTVTSFSEDTFRPVGHQSIGYAPIPGIIGKATVTASPPGAWSGGQVDSLQDAVDALAEGTNSVGLYEMVNFTDPEGSNDGGFGGGVPFPNDTGADDEDFGVRVEGKLLIPFDGLYQLGYNSDDGAALWIDGVTWDGIVAGSHGSAVIDGEWLKTDALTGTSWTAGETYLEGGVYDFEALFFERGGGAGLELFARGNGFDDRMDWHWYLTESDGPIFFKDFDGLQLVPEPSTWVLLSVGLIGLLVYLRKRRKI